jgi:mRNA interferase RelE/StbE
LSYRVLLHPKAAEFLETSDAPLGERIEDRLRELVSSPKETGRRLKYSPFWRPRMGDYRAMYEVGEEEKRVIVLFIGHRREVCDDFSRLL